MLPLGASINVELGRILSLIFPFPCAVPQYMDQLTGQEVDVEFPL